TRGVAARPALSGSDAAATGAARSAIAAGRDVACEDGPQDLEGARAGHGAAEGMSAIAAVAAAAMENGPRAALTSIAARAGLRLVPDEGAVDQGGGALVVHGAAHGGSAVRPVAALSADAETILAPFAVRAVGAHGP